MTMTVKLEANVLKACIAMTDQKDRIEELRSVYVSVKENTITYMGANQHSCLRVKRPFENPDNIETSFLVSAKHIDMIKKEEYAYMMLEDDETATFIVGEIHSRISSITFNKELFDRLVTVYFDNEPAEETFPQFGVNMELVMNMTKAIKKLGQKTNILKFSYVPENKVIHVWNHGNAIDYDGVITAYRLIG